MSRRHPRQTRRVQASGSFKPTNLSGAVLWLRADLGITIATGVSAWADQSGNGNNATQATGANQPLFVASSTMNGRPSVRFNGVAQVLSTTTGATTTDHTIIVAGKWVALPAAQKAFIDFGDGAAAGNGSSIGALNVGNNNWYGYAGYGLPTGVAFNTNAHVWSKTYTSTGPLTSGFYDRTADGTDNVRTYAAGTAVISVGANPGSAVFANFEMTEVVIYSRVLSAAERNSVENYMKSRYGTP